MNNSETARERAWLIAGAVFAVMMAFMNLGSDGMYAAQEGRTAIITRNMLLSGNYMDMTVPGGVPYEKPVGHYWLCVPFAKLFHLDAPETLDTAAEWALRLPSALSALLAALAAAALASRIYDRRAGAVTLVVLSSMLTFCHLAHVAHIDMPLTAAFTTAMFFLYIGYLEEFWCNRWIYGFYAMLGWGMVLKGPLVAILAGLAVLALMVWTRRWRMVWELRPLTGGALFLLVALPWYVAETIRTDGGFFQEFIINQNLRRFTGVGSTYRGGEWMPVWYYIPRLFLGALPWSLPAVAALIFYRKPLARLRFKPGTVFLVMWFLTGFVFFSLSALKRGDYLLPIYPPLAILIARAVELACDRLPPLSRRWQWGVLVLAAAAATLLALNRAGVFTAFGEAILSRKISWISKGDGSNILAFSSFVNAHFPAAAAVFAGLAVLIWYGGAAMTKRRYGTAFWALTAVVLAVNLGYYYVLSPGTDRLRTVKPLVREAHRLTPPVKHVAYIGTFNTEMIFFMNRPYEHREITPEADTVIALPEAAKALLKTQPTVWREVLRTPKGHKYPAILLRRVTAPAK